MESADWVSSIKADVAWSLLVSLQTRWSNRKELEIARMSWWNVECCNLQSANGWSQWSVVLSLGGMSHVCIFDLGDLGTSIRIGQLSLSKVWSDVTRMSQIMRGENGTNNSSTILSMVHGQKLLHCWFTPCRKHLFIVVESSLLPELITHCLNQLPSWSVLHCHESSWNGIFLQRNAPKSLSNDAWPQHPPAPNPPLKFLLPIH